MELIFNNLEVVWFILITVLFAGFFLLEGFDYVSTTASSLVP